MPLGAGPPTPNAVHSPQSPFRPGGPPMSAPLTRRQALRAAMAVGLGLAAGPAPAADAKPRYRVAACDWMMVKRQKLGALPLAKECGLDGLEVDMGSLGDGSDIRNELRKPEIRRQYLDTARDLGIEICSLAMSAFYAQSYAEHPRAEVSTAEWIDLMPKLGVTVGFLPLGV